MLTNKWVLDGEGNGYFQYLFNNEWAQFYKDKTFPFVEMSRGVDFIDLLAVGRDVKVRLTEGQLYQDIGQGFLPSSTGHFQ